MAGAQQLLAELWRLSNTGLRLIDWRSPLTHIYTVALLLGFFWITRSPELRKERFRLGAITVVFFGACLIALACRTPLEIAVSLVLLRPILFIYGLSVSNLVGHYASLAVEGIIHGTHQQPRPSVSFALVRHFRATGRHRRALSLARRLVKQAEDPFEGAFLLASIYVEDLHDLAGARPWVQMILQSPMVASSLKEFTFHQFNQWRKVLDPDARPLRFDPGTVGSKAGANPFQKARMLLQDGQVEDAITAAQAEIRKHPDSIEGLYLLARIHGEIRNDPDEAEPWIKRILAQPYLPSGYARYLKETLEEWRERRLLPVPDNAFADRNEASTEMPSLESARRLRSRGFLGTAIDHLNHLLRNGRSEDLECLTLLTEIHAEDCTNIKAAERAVRRIEMAASIAESDKTRMLRRLKQWQEDAVARPWRYT